jgi:CheY-like chemotaxis protein
MSKPRVLLVEDDPDIQEVLQFYLQKLGFEVLSAYSGEEALAATVWSHGLDLLVTDLVMGGMDGRALAKAVKKRHPQIPVVLITGYGETGSGGEPNTVDIVLPKPVTASELSRAIAEVTRKNSGPGSLLK